jgi:ketosteroid isomerase-like protein
MKPQRSVLALLLLALAGCSPAVDMEQEVEALMQADRDFNRMTAESGVEGWMANFAPDGAMFQAGQLLRGENAVRQLMTPALGAPGFSLTWDPEYAEVSGAGDLGYTIGRFESRMAVAEGDTVTGTGSYVTIWRRDDEGAWKVVVDIGNPDEGN